MEIKQYELSTMFINAPKLAISLGYIPSKFDMLAAHINMVRYSDIFEIARDCIDDIKEGVELSDISYHLKFFLLLMPIWMLWPILWPIFLPMSIEKFNDMVKREECQCRCGGCKRV